MKKQYLLFVINLFVNFFVNAQNVGINDFSPSAKLTIKGSETTANGEAAAIKLQNTAASTGNAWFIRAGAIGTNTPNNGFSIADNIGYHFNIAPGGNIGLGIAPSIAKLHVNGEMKIQGSNTLEFGAGVAGKEINAGKIGYNSFVADGLSIVGSGTTASNRKVYVFAEGGTTFNGPINVWGSTGTTGQVLTSNNLAAPSWQTLNTAFSNDVRFESNIYGTSAVSLTPALSYSTAYNLNTSVISISTSGITVNRSGLYHIEGYLELHYSLNRAPAYIQQGLTVRIDGRAYQQSVPETFDVNPATSFSYQKFIRFVNEVNISAPGLIDLMIENSFNLGTASIVSCTHSGKVSGYLISE